MEFYSKESEAAVCTDLTKIGNWRLENNCDGIFFQSSIFQTMSDHLCVIKFRGHEQHSDCADVCSHWAAHVYLHCSFLNRFNSIINMLYSTCSDHTSKKKYNVGFDKRSCGEHGKRTENAMNKKKTMIASVFSGKANIFLQFAAFWLMVFLYLISHFQLWHLWSFSSRWSVSLPTLHRHSFILPKQMH